MFGLARIENSIEVFLNDDLSPVLVLARTMIERETKSSAIEATGSIMTSNEQARLYFMSIGEFGEIHNPIADDWTNTKAPFLRLKMEPALSGVNPQVCSIQKRDLAVEHLKISGIFLDMAGYQGTFFGLQADSQQTCEQHVLTSKFVYGILLIPHQHYLQMIHLDKGMCPLTTTI